MKLYFTQKTDLYGRFTLNELNEVLNKFSLEYSIPIDDIEINVEYDRGYYDSIETSIELSGRREENTIEMEQRKIKEAEVKAVEKAAKKRAKLAKELAEQAEYERLKKKYEHL